MLPTLPRNAPSQSGRELAERRDRTFFRMGIDSNAVLAAYLGGLVLLYTLKGDG